MNTNTTETLLETISTQCDSLRTLLVGATQELHELTRRLEQIVQQLRKNIDVRDANFATDFNDYRKPGDWTEDLILPAKGLNSRAKTLSRACDEFITAYDIFARVYKGFTAVKLNVWLLTACQSDASLLTGKILFLAREITKHTEQKRGNYVAG